MRQQGSAECVWNISEQIQGPTGHNCAKAKGCQRHYFDMCCMVQPTENTPRQSRLENSQSSNLLIICHNLCKVQVFITSEKFLKIKIF